MRNLIAFCVFAFVLSFLAGCQTLGTGAQSLGPDSIQTDTPASTLPARIKAGATWLWSSYAALKAKGYAIPAMEDLRETILDIEAVADKGDITAALDLYMRARALVTQIVTVAS